MNLFIIILHNMKTIKKIIINYRVQLYYAEDNIIL